MPTLGWVIVAVAGWLAFARFCAWVNAAAVRGDVESGLLMRLFQVYARVVHRLRVEGLEHVPTGWHPGPLIVVANHSAGVDPVLVQAAVPFEISWVMAEDMRVGWLNPVWELGRVVFVDRAKGETLGVRAATKRLREGGVLGVFPEGHIERPARELLPFLPGVGMFVSRSGAPVLPVIIEGTPQVDPAWSSLWRPSRSRLRFLPMVRFERGVNGRRVAEELRALFVRETGWPTNDAPPRLHEGRWVQGDGEPSGYAAWWRSK